MENEPNWLENSTLNYSEFLKWANGFRDSKIILNSDLVVSDNYAVPLLANKHTLLMGSFLWSDIIQNEVEDIRKIKAFQEKIITQNKTEMIALNGMYMDSLQKKANIFSVPWFTQRRVEKKKRSYNKILVTSGGTEQLDDVFLNLIERLSSINTSKGIFLDSKLYKKFKIIGSNKFLNVKLFDFTDECFKSLDVIICRPGIGILTDCVSYLIPSVVIYNNKNLEIAHNANKVEVIGVGRAIEINDDFISEEQLQEINSFLDLKEAHSMCHQNLLKQKINGHQDAAHKIINTMF